MNFKEFIKLIFKCFSFAVILIILLCLYPVFVEPNLLVVKHKTLYLPNWSEKHNGLKVAVLSDFHVNKWGISPKKLKKVVSKTNAENADLICLLGDLDSYLIEREKLDKKDLTNTLSKLKAKYGVISILGNHDYGPRVVKPILKNAGITVLENKRTVIWVNDEPIIIYGLKDLWQYSPKAKNVVKKDENVKSMILLSHNPDLFPDVPGFVSLTLSGHTHGGQICLPILGGIFTPSVWEQRYNKGYIVEDSKHLFVTSGLGFSIPIRFGNPPEIVILELYSQDTYPNKVIKNTKELTGIRRSLNSWGMEISTKVLNYVKDL